MYRSRKIFSHIFARIVAHYFHKIYYYVGRYEETWMDTWWMGTRVYKSPFDMWVYQEILYEKKPDLIIETGTAFGGSALFLANILDIINKGEIFTVDIVVRNVPRHQRINYLIGSSIDKHILAKISNRAKDKSVMVILDSDHSMEHVKKELDIYSNFVSKNQYLIVEDTNINGHPVHKNAGPGPMEALNQFMQSNCQFKIDVSREKHLFSFNPKGFLLRVDND